MRSIEVNLPLNSYEIRIGGGLLEQIPGCLKELGFKDRAVLITNPIVNELYGKQLIESLKSGGFKVTVLEVPDGEEEKSLERAGKLYTELSEVKAERLTPVLALGGGVIGDLAGFVAATYMRGLPLIHIPTTLLAQVDSSIGGKVAVNHGHLKNMIGAFYQPRLVISDTSTLKTLPEKELGNGFAEIIKYGVIRDKELFSLIENNMEALKALDESLIEEVVARCAGIKAEVVTQDEKDTGLRNILNYGHTVGHGIEAVSEFRLSHGYGVAIGMVAAGMISQRMGALPQIEMERIRAVIEKAGLPTTVSGMDIEEILEAMKHDKKISGGKLKFILAEKIGEVFISDQVSAQTLEQVLKELKL